MVKEWNKTIDELHIGLQNKIHKANQWLIGGYQNSGPIERNVVFMQKHRPT